ncbi:TPA: phosphatase [Vibrio parahaemolyticus]|uniref:phosphatase n=1 Tax=Vibrio parahaemolyticus TaxID=670 RepID=UPI001122742B|nr:phosphatase [Vibrio parahaemolyticus]TOL88892.1 phosphatase [Vibrio parahaemolyticus]HCG9714489.1 phosphatase [Vibrio parahaemolyticus]HCH1153061.1 phosphatase [Vibrio parahaemolyticus]HCM1332975.1 phosphatase [Vibrio parahaemolyticus]
METIQGDIFELIKSKKYDVLIHGCNCFCNMRAGFALYLKKLYPEVLKADQGTPIGSANKLGTYSLCKITIHNHEMIVVNAYTQFHWHGEGVLADYDAIRKVFSSIKQEFHGHHIIYPKIGAGLAKGNWLKIKEIIDEELSGEKHTYVEYKKGANKY